MGRRSYDSQPQPAEGDPPSALENRVDNEVDMDVDMDIDAIEREIHVDVARAAVRNAYDDEERATALVTLATAAAFADLVDEAHAALGQALGAAQRAGDGELLLRVRAGRLSVHQSLGDEDAVLDELAHLAAQSESLGHWDLLTVWLGALSDASGADGDPEEALRYLERARIAADRAEDPTLVAKVAVARAEWTEATGRLPEARLLTEAAVEAAAAIGAAEEVAHQRCRLGLLSFRLEDFAAAHDQLLAAQREFAFAGLASAGAQLNRNIGAAALHLGRVDEARTRLVAALDLARSDGDRLEEGRIALDLGELARLTSDYSTARHRYSSAAGIAAELGDEGMAVSASFGLASVASAQGRWREALIQSESALSRSRARDDRLGSVNGLIHVGQLLRVLGQSQASEHRLREAAQLATESGYGLGEANASHGLGFLYQQAGRLGAAHAQFQRSLTLAFELGDRVGAANTFLGLNLVALTAGRYDEAETEAATGLEVAHQIGYRRMEQQLLRQLALVALERGHAVSARRHLDQARAIGVELDDASGMADNDSVLGELLWRLGAAEEAKTVLRAALDRHRRIEDRLGAAVDLRRLADVSLASGKTSEGVDLLRAAVVEFDAIGAMEELARSLGTLAAALGADDPESRLLAARSLRLLDRLAESLPAGWDPVPLAERHAALRRHVTTAGEVRVGADTAP